MSVNKEATPDLKSGKSSKTVEDFAKYFQPPSLKEAKNGAKKKFKYTTTLISRKR